MRILFVHNALRSFVRVDRDILASVHEVDELDLSTPVRIASLPLRLGRADLVYAWFASLHSAGPVLAASLLRRPSIVVAGGYDTASMPEIGYGHMAHPVKRHIVRLICNRATALLANSHSAAAEIERNTGTGTPIHVVYHGFEAGSVPISGEGEHIVLTVGNVNRANLLRKGHEAFVRTAALVPGVRFILVGGCSDDAGERLRSIAPGNLELPGCLSQAALDELYSRASVYVQASAHEGFGCSLVEAMMAGCFPVVSRRGALPEVVGEHGLYVDESDPAGMARAVRQALAAAPPRRQEIASYAAASFSLEQRRQALLELVSDVGARPAMAPFRPDNHLSSAQWSEPNVPNS